MVEAVKPFNAVEFKTKDSKTIQATNNDGSVTTNGDTNGARQIEVNDFANYLAQETPAINKTPSCDSVSFKSKTTQNEQEEKTEKKGPSTAKKVGVGVASFCITGLGQLINGQVAKGLGFFAGAAVSSLALGLICPPLGIVSSLGITAWSVVDAVKNAK